MERDEGDALLSRAAPVVGPLDVGVSLARGVELHDHVNILDVNIVGGHIRGNQNVERPGAEGRSCR